MSTKQYDNYADLITFSRSSGGTALRPISYGDELVTNGDFDSDVSGWPTIAAVSPTWDAGRLSQVHDYQSTGAYQTFSTTVGKIYEATGTLVSSSLFTSNFLLRAGNGTAPNAGLVDSESISSNNTTVSVVFVATGTTSYVYLRGDSGATSVWDNVSVKEVLFDQPNAPLTLFNHPADIPRIEYDADGNRLGLLIEESRTNLLPYSEDFTDAQWSKTYSVAVSPSSEAAPNGQKVAYELTGIESSDGDAGISEFISASASTTYTGTVWFKAKNASDVGKYVRLRLKRNGGTFVAQSESVQLTNSWVRHEVTLTLLSDNTGIGFIITKDSTQNTVDRADECLIYGAQLEEGAFPTSYIKSNSGSTTTRAADDASIPVSAFGYNQSEGTVVCEFDSNGSDGADYPRVFALSNTSGADLARFLINPTNTTTVAVTVASSGVALTGWSGSISENETEKIAVAIKTNSFAASLSGGAAQIDTSGAVPSKADLLAIGTQYNLLNNYLNGHIKSIRYFPRRLTNAQLQELTT